MSVAYLAEHLERFTAVGRGQWIARCPCHPDTDPSLNVTLRPNADQQWRLFLHCPVCGANGEDVRIAAGMRRVEAFIPSAEDIAGMQKPKHSPPLPTPAMIQMWQAQLDWSALSEWRGFADEYVVLDFGIGWDDDSFTLPVYDESHRLVNLIRCKPNGVPKMWPGSHPTLYPTLPEHDWVLIVEGVWDALCGRSYGLPTVSGTGGAAYWDDRWSVALRRYRRVVVVYDCDEPGRKGAQKVASRLPQAEVVDLAPRRHSGYDLSDHLRKYQSTDRLMELITKSEGPLRQPFNRSRGEERRNAQGAGPFGQEA